MEIRNYNDLVTIANQQGKSPAQVAIESGRMEFLANVYAWPEPLADDVDDDVYPDIDLLGTRSDILSDYVRNISASIQFPINTAYLLPNEPYSTFAVDGHFKGVQRKAFCPTEYLDQLEDKLKNGN